MRVRVDHVVTRYEQPFHGPVFEFSVVVYPEQKEFERTWEFARKIADGIREELAFFLEPRIDSKNESNGKKNDSIRPLIFEKG